MFLRVLIVCFVNCLVVIGCVVFLCAKLWQEMTRKWTSYAVFEPRRVLGTLMVSLKIKISLPLRGLLVW